MILPKIPFSHSSLLSPESSMLAQGLLEFAESQPLLLQLAQGCWNSLPKEGAAGRGLPPPGLGSLGSAAALCRFLVLAPQRGQCELEDVAEGMNLLLRHLWERGEKGKVIREKHR